METPPPFDSNYDTEQLYEALSLKDKALQTKAEKISRLNSVIDNLKADLSRIRDLDNQAKQPATTETVLEEAARITSADRQESYGHPLHNHTATAQMFAIYYSRRYGLDIPFDAEDVCFFHIVEKVSRWANGQARDNLTDTAGYARNIEMCAEERERLKSLESSRRPIVGVEPGEGKRVFRDAIKEILGTMQSEEFSSYPTVPRNEAGTPQLEHGYCCAACGKPSGKFGVPLGSADSVCGALRIPLGSLICADCYDKAAEDPS